MERVTTSTAVVEITGGGIVVCRYMPGAKVTAAGINENIEARRKLAGSAPHLAVTVLPSPEDFDMTMLKQDHYAGVPGDDSLQAQAMVAEGAVMFPLAKLYFAYFPTRFRNEVFASEPEAMAWIRDQQGMFRR
ncbi:MAG: hypothetical protein KJZ58_01770 [Flavobacteriales bacterium]|nr:hypothetical protein [Flavobacteriales bacterium]